MLLVRALTILAKTTLLSIMCLMASTGNAQESDPIENSQEPVNSNVNQVKFITKDDFMLAGKYFAGGEEAPGVLLLHDCDHDSSYYDKISQLLSGYGIHAFSLDFRGYGNSVSDVFSHAQIKRNAKDINTYQTEITRITSFWQADVLAAYEYLRSKLDKKSHVAVVSAGCSAAQAVSLAQKMRINSFVMITPILDYMEKENYKNLIDIPVYFISSAHQASTYQTAKELFNWNGDNRSIFQILKGNRQGQSLLHGKKYLAHDIALWLKDTLVK